MSRTYIAHGGEDISHSAEKMVAMAIDTQEDVICEFNGINLVARPGYIVGQALSCLQSVGAVHHVCLIFIEKWMSKFHPEKQS